MMCPGLTKPFMMRSIRHVKKNQTDKSVQSESNMCLGRASELYGSQTAVVR